MKSFVKWLIILFIVLLAVILFAWSFVPGMLSKELTQKAGVPVSISSVGLTPWSITVSDFTIGNPPGSILSKALYVGTTKIKTPFYRYFEDKIVINEATLNNIYLGLEFEKPFSQKGNWTQIMKNFDRNSKGEDGKPVLIKKLIITNMDIEIAFRDNPSQPPKRLKGIKRMELSNVSSESGLPIAAITNQVIGSMLQEVFNREGIQNMIQGIFNPSQSSGGVFGGLKELFGANEFPESELLNTTTGAGE